MFAKYSEDSEDLSSKSLAIRQKGESQNGCFRKTNNANFSEKPRFLTPETHSQFALLPYYRRNLQQLQCLKFQNFAPSHHDENFQTHRFPYLLPCPSPLPSLHPTIRMESIIRVEA